MKKYITIGCFVFAMSVSASIVIPPQGSIVHNAGSIEVNGNWINNGTYNQTAGVLKFIGGTDNTIQKTGGETIKNLAINKSGSAKVNLGSNLIITGALTMQTGKIATGSNQVILGASGAINGESAASFVEGILSTQRTVSTTANTMGNIGLNLASGTNVLGLVTVSRATGTLGTNIVNGKSAILRSWNITSQNAISGLRDVTASWLSNEDNSNNISAIRFWKLAAKDGKDASGNDMLVSSQRDQKALVDKKAFTDEKGWSAITNALDGSSRSVTFGLPSTGLITACDAIAGNTSYPFVENFEATTFPPVNWTTSPTNSTIVPPTYPWEVKIGSGVGASKCAKATYTPAGVKILNMPPLDIPANYRLRFSWRNHDAKSALGNNLSGSQRVDKLNLAESSTEKIIDQDSTFCEISTNGTTWTKLRVLSAAATQSAYTEEKIDLTPYAGAGVLIRWRYKTNASSTAYGSLLDDVNVEGIPTFSITPTTYSYGSQQLLDIPTERLFSISNTGIGSLKVNSATLGGTNSVDFAIEDANTYPVSLSANQSISLKVKFNPLTIGEKTALLNINSNDKGVHAATLTGIAFDSTITTFPYSQNFEEANFPPNGWDNSTGYGWAQLAGSGVGASKCVRAYYLPAVLTNKILTTPPINLTDNKILRFSWRNNDTKGQDSKIKLLDTTYCEISTNNTTWTVLKELSAAAPETIYKEETANLATYAGNRAKFRWRYKTLGSTSAYSALLDDIFIEEPSSIGDNLIPKETKLHSNYPNPFNNSTKIRFDLSESKKVSLLVYNYKGEKVRQLINATLQPGYYDTTLDASSLASGVYFCIFQAGDYKKNIKMILTK